ncbi:ATP-binding protein [Flavobacterium endoglycinae]|uniref:ATP-binding protein n=1 Tax=Flavobacterium endoglycinae TaxID=2816357 RepID=A0ABX7QCU2_9FLAO|nr:ATP-binding protein [Flavobacterium endoglycinae]QSW88413.1 ATP-binding protein [Flavobacterium endoglycinae]
MIEEFSFGNMCSFKDIQTLNMSAAKIKSNNSLLDEQNVIQINENLSLLKSKAIYGANASGKSNVIRGLVTFMRIIKNSVKDERSLEFIDAFELSTETMNEPTFFQMILRIDNVRYRYGFEADDSSIKSEWLFSTPNIREQNLFIRENSKILEINQKHFEEGFKLLSLMDDFKDYDDGEIFRKNSLFLSSLASFGFGKLSKKIIKAINSISVISGLGHQGMYAMAGESLEDIDQKKFVLNFLKNADIGIQDLETIDLSAQEFSDHIDEDFRDSKLILSHRTRYNKQLKKDGNASFSFLLQESEGTRKMFELSPFIYRSLKEGTTLVIDEFDSRFHPLLTKKIVELYNSNQNSKAQLIFTTHDTNLLSAEILRRDQIDFVEKDKYGASHLYTLVEIKGIRNNASFEKDYIQGKYGAIPFLGNFSNLLNFE